MVLGDSRLKHDVWETGCLKSDVRWLVLGYNRPLGYTVISLSNLGPLMGHNEFPQL